MVPWPPLTGLRMSGRVEPSPEGLAHRLRLAEALVREMLPKRESWHGRMEGFGDEGTVFEYCRECGTVEWRDHRPGCQYVDLRDRVRGYLAVRGRDPVLTDER